ncbi:MAG: serpin family protein [Bacteroidetes bacterium]|nr:serpin family protein [Bacteroidota bacterium]
MKKAILILATLPLFLMMTNCEKSPSPEGKSISISENFAQKTDNFAFEFWKAVNNDEKPETNYFVSPLSLHIALGMLLNGADTETKAEIQKMLGFENENMDEINKTYKILIDNLPLVDPKVVNTIANSVWQNKDFLAEKSYTDILSANFNARLYTEDFGNPATVNKINQWAADNTNQKIKKILDQIKTDDVMFLINALYFKGDWSKQFKTENTTKHDFTGIKSKNKVDMMTQTDEFRFVENDQLKLVELPYGNEKYAMKILLPKNNNLHKVISDLTPSSWNTLEQSMVKQKVVVGLPKFTLEYSKKLNDILGGMGMKKAFSDQADLSKIMKPAGKIKVGFVKQDTFLSVDEKGTEAAAVTSIGIVLTSMPSYPEIICDQPFAIVITEKSSDTIMFVGIVSNL